MIHWCNALLVERNIVPRYKVLKEVYPNHAVVFMPRLLPQPDFADIFAILVDTDDHQVGILREKVPVSVKLDPELGCVGALHFAVGDDKGVRVVVRHEARSTFAYGVYDLVVCRPCQVCQRGPSVSQHKLMSRCVDFGISHLHAQHLELPMEVSSNAMADKVQVLIRKELRQATESEVAFLLQVESQHHAELVLGDLALPVQCRDEERPRNVIFWRQSY